MVMSHSGECESTRSDTVCLLTSRWRRVLPLNCQRPGQAGSAQGRNCFLSSRMCSPASAKGPRVIHFSEVQVT